METSLEKTMTSPGCYAEAHAFIAIGILPWVYLITQCLKQLLLSSETRDLVTDRSRKNSPQTRDPHYFGKSKDAFLAGNSCFLSLGGIIPLWKVFPSSMITHPNRPLFPPFWNSCRFALASLSETVNWFSVSAIWPWDPSILPEVWGSEASRANLVWCTSPSLLFFFLPLSSAILPIFQFWTCFSHVLCFLSPICQKFPPAGGWGGAVCYSNCRDIFMAEHAEKALIQHLSQGFYKVLSSAQLGKGRPWCCLGQVLGYICCKSSG